MRSVANKQIRISALTDTGNVRQHNEDNFIVSPDLSRNSWILSDRLISLSPLGSLMVVADGMGGANAGEVASAIAIESIRNFFTSAKIPQPISTDKAKEYLKKAIHLAHRKIIEQSVKTIFLQGMGTTIIVAWIFNEKVVVSWSGDSRGYLYRKEEGIKIITRDHSLVWEFVEAGKISAMEADIHPQNNIITQSLGDAENPPQPGFVVRELKHGDKILLCSDGLNNMIPHTHIEAIVGQPLTLSEINKQLIHAAKEKGGHDNITSLLLEYHSHKKQVKTGNHWTIKVSVFLIILLLCLGFALLNNEYEWIYFKKYSNTVTEFIGKWITKKKGI